MVGTVLDNTWSGILFGILGLALADGRGLSLSNTLPTHKRSILDLRTLPQSSIAGLLAKVERDTPTASTFGLKNHHSIYQHSHRTLSIPAFPHGTATTRQSHFRRYSIPQPIMVLCLLPNKGARTIRGSNSDNTKKILHGFQFHQPS